MAAPDTMTKAEFRRALKALGLSVYASPQVIGGSLSTSQRYAAGSSPIPQAVANLLRLMVALKVSAQTVRSLPKV